MPSLGLVFGAIPDSKLQPLRVDTSAPIRQDAHAEELIGRPKPATPCGGTILPKVNPYIAGNPVGGEDAFIGRADVLTETLRMLRQPSASALVLYGQRRIGKTSVLLELAARLPKMGPYLPIYFDLQDKAAMPLAKVLGQLADVARDKLPDLGDEDGDLAPDAFRDRFLTAALNHLEDETSLVFLFDEFDVLDEPKRSKAGEEFFPFLRSLLTFKPERVRFVFVIGRRTEDLSNLTLSLFKATRTVHVSLLAKPDVESLVRLSERNGSLSWTDAAVEGVYSLAGGHPYLTQQLCQEVWERVVESSRDSPAQATSEDVAQAVEPTLRSATSALNWLWGGLGPAQRVVAAVLAEAGPDPIAEAEIRHRLQESGVRVLIGELRDAPRVLGDWDLIEPAENGFRFRVELLRRWIVSHKPLERVREEMDHAQPVADNLYQAAYGLYKSDDFDQAVELLRRVTTLNPNHSRGHELLAEILLAQGKRDEARELLEGLYSYMPDVAGPRLVQILLRDAQSAKAYEKKAGLYERVLKLEPNQREARRLLVPALLGQARRTNDGELRWTLYKRVLELEPSESDATEGLLKLRRQALAQSLEELKSLENNHRFEEALTLGERLHREFSDLQVPLPDLKLMRRRTLLEGKYQQAVGALGEGDRNKARQLLVEIVQLTPEYRETTRLLHEAVHGVDLRKKLDEPREPPPLATRPRVRVSRPSMFGVVFKNILPYFGWGVSIVISLIVAKAGIDYLFDGSEEPTPSGVTTTAPPSTATVLPEISTSLATTTTTPPARPRTPPPLKHKAGELLKTSVGMELRYIPPGHFIMGSPPEEIGRKVDEPQRKVILSQGFWMGETEVTQAQWFQLMRNDPSRFAACGVNCPVEQVNWFDALAFSNRMSKKEGVEVCYRLSGCEGTPGRRYTCRSVVPKGKGCRGYRLPTEPEWEYAARAGTTTAFWTGNNLTTNQANYNGNFPYSNGAKGVYREKTVAVRTFGANPWGLYEVHGNVSEWVEDKFDSSSASPDRIARGGSWFHIANGCRAAFRIKLDPGTSANYTGFRLVKTSHDDF